MVFCHNSECFLLKRVQLIEADPKENKLVAMQLVRNQEVDLVFVQPHEPDVFGNQQTFNSEAVF